MKQGFFLIELMLYISLTLTLMLISFKLSVLVINKLRTIHANSFIVTQLYTALRAFENDLENSPSQADQWSKLERHKLQWKTNNTKITWKIKEKKILRTIGHFDAIKQRWKKEGTSILAERLIDGNFVVKLHENQIEEIHYMVTGQLLNGKNIILEQSVWPMNGRILF